MNYLIQISFLIVLALLSAGCNDQNKLDTPQKILIDKKLSTVNYKTIRTLPYIQDVALEWEYSTDDNAIGYYLYRANAKEYNGDHRRIAKIDNKFTSHFVDNNLKSNTTYYYSFSVISNKGGESFLSRAIKVKTLKTIEPVSLIVASSDLPRQIKVLWRPDLSLNVKAYIIERSEPKTNHWYELATIPNKLSAEYIDINLNDYQEFKYRIKTVTFDGIISDASKSAKARTHRIPFIVKGIKTTTNLPKTIKIKWQHINNKRTLSAYNIYGSDFRTGKYQHLDTIDIDDNTYSHELKKDGRIMYYKITTISNEGVETNLKLISATRGTTLRKPNAPIIKKSYSLNRKIHLSWKAGGPRTKYYYLYKQKIINGLLVDGENRTKLNASTTKIVDTSVKIGEKYRYTIQAIDKYDITSKKIVFKTLKVVIQ